MANSSIWSQKFGESDVGDNVILFYDGDRFKMLVTNLCFKLSTSKSHQHDCIRHLVHGLITDSFYIMNGFITGKVEKPVQLPISLLFQNSK